MTTTPDFQLPPSVRGLEGLAQREDHRDPAPPEIPSHYATSLSELRNAQRARPAQVAPAQVAPAQVTPAQVTPAQEIPRPAEGGYTLSDDVASSLAELLSSVVGVLRSIARSRDDVSHARLESLARRIDSIELSTQTPTRGGAREIDPRVIEYMLERRSQGVRYRLIAEELNERAQRDPALAPPVAREWTANNIRRLAHRSK